MRSEWWNQTLGCWLSLSEPQRSCLSVAMMIHLIGCKASVRWPRQGPGPRLGRARASSYWLLSFLFFFLFFIYIFLAVLGLRFVRGLSPVVASGGHSSSRCAGLSLRGLSRCGAQAPDAQAQQLWLTGPAAPRHVGSSQTRARTRVPCIRQADSQPLRHQGSPPSFSYTLPLLPFQPLPVPLLSLYHRLSSTPHA